MYICVICDDKFDTRYELKGHFMAHSNWGVFCSYPGCGKTYSNESNMRQHLWSNHEPPPYTIYTDLPYYEELITATTRRKELQAKTKILQKQIMRLLNQAPSRCST